MSSPASAAFSPRAASKSAPPPTFMDQKSPIPFSSQNNPLQRLASWKKQESVRRVVTMRLSRDTNSSPSTLPTSPSSAQPGVQPTVEFIRKKVSDAPSSDDITLSTGAAHLAEWKEEFNTKIQAIQEEIILYLSSSNTASEEETVYATRAAMSDLKICVSDLLNTMSTILKKFTKKSKKAVTNANSYWQGVLFDVNNQLEHITRVAAFEEEKRRNLEKENSKLKQQIASLKADVVKPYEEYKKLARQLETEKAVLAKQKQQLENQIQLQQKLLQRAAASSTPKSPQRTPRKKETPATPRDSRSNTPKSPARDAKPTIEEPKAEPQVIVQPAQQPPPAPSPQLQLQEPAPQSPTPQMQTKGVPPRPGFNESPSKPVTPTRFGVSEPPKQDKSPAVSSPLVKPSTPNPSTPPQSNFERFKNMFDKSSPQPSSPRPEVSVSSPKVQLGAKSVPTSPAVATAPQQVPTSPSPAPSSPIPQPVVTPSQTSSPSTPRSKLAQFREKNASPGTTLQSVTPEKPTPSATVPAAPAPTTSNDGEPSVISKLKERVRDKIKQRTGEASSEAPVTTPTEQSQERSRDRIKEIIRQRKEAKTAQQKN